MERVDARPEVMAWIITELREYADKKWTREDKEHTTWDEGVADWHDRFLHEYLHRARLLGYMTPRGQQALMKALVTAFEMCVTMYVGLDGKLPLPGHPSGDIMWGQEVDMGRVE